jgi:hypothetical protein
VLLATYGNTDSTNGSRLRAGSSRGQFLKVIGTVRIYPNFKLRKVVATDMPLQDEYVEAHLEEDNELVLARLRKTQSSLQTTLRQIDTDLARLQKNLLSTRRLVWVRTGFM